MDLYSLSFTFKCDTLQTTSVSRVCRGGYDDDAPACTYIPVNYIDGKLVKPAFTCIIASEIAKKTTINDLHEAQQTMNERQTDNKINAYVNHYKRSLLISLIDGDT